MRKKLKRSFVTTAMISAALVIVILMGVVNLLAAIERNRSDTEILQFLLDNGGRFPTEELDAPGDSSGEPMGEGDSGENQFPDDLQGPGDSAGDSAADSTSDSSNEEVSDENFHEGFNGFAPQIFDPFANRRITVETPYETRFFSVLMAKDGQVLDLDVTHIAAITDEDASEMASSLRSAGKAEGSINEYRYMSSENDDVVLYVFLDCNKSIRAVKDFLLYSIIVTVIGLLVLFGIAWLFSGRAIRPIMESYNKQKSFITNAGHELKTPLAVIESNTEVIELENGESQWTASIHNQVKRLSNLTKDLISLSRMDEENSRPELEEVDVSELITDLLESYELMAEQYDLTLSADIAPGVVIRTNRSYMEKIVTILADNAVKYTSDKGNIHFSLAKEGNKVILTEKNPAEGLTAGKLDKLFDRFYRGDSSRNSETQGYGLGLPMARQLVETLGGSIRAESPDGKNIVFTIHMS